MNRKRHRDENRLRLTFWVYGFRTRHIRNNNTRVVCVSGTNGRNLRASFTPTRTALFGRFEHHDRRTSFLVYHSSGKVGLFYSLTKVCK